MSKKKKSVKELLKTRNLFGRVRDWNAVAAWVRPSGPMKNKRYKDCEDWIKDWEEELEDMEKESNEKNC